MTSPAVGAGAIAGAAGGLRAEALLAWSSRTRRDLPWRHTRDPWAILVSETMLAQTQVARVVASYQAFVARWPEPSALAAAPLAEVIEAWQGLGYYRRAVRLHACAQVIVAHHGGRIPGDLGKLLALPGVGPYTARAVLVFAFEQPAGVLDTNAARVLARAFTGRRLSGREAQMVADGVVPPGRPWDWNSAMLDLGATVCVARRPNCQRCPLAGSCCWHVAGRPDPDPAVGTAGASGRQSRFSDSDRQGRGRLVAALLGGPLGPASLVAAAGWPTDRRRAERVAMTLVADGLATVDDQGTFHLP